VNIPDVAKNFARTLSLHDHRNPRVCFLTALLADHAHISWITRTLLKKLRLERMSQASEPELKVTLTVPLIHTKSRSRKYERYVTRGFYLNISQEIIEQMKLKGHELVEITIKKLK
jgi:hypothetical protein